MVGSGPVSNSGNLISLGCLVFCYFLTEVM